MISWVNAKQAGLVSPKNVPAARWVLKDAVRDAGGALRATSYLLVGDKELRCARVLACVVFFLSSVLFLAWMVRRRAVLWTPL